MSFNFFGMGSEAMCSDISLRLRGCFNDASIVVGQEAAKLGLEMVLRQAHVLRLREATDIATINKHTARNNLFNVTCSLHCT